MKISKKIIIILLAVLLFGFLILSNDDTGQNFDVPVTGNDHIKYFGFASVDCGYDDPRDESQKKDYSDEVADFSNIAHLCPTDFTDVEPKINKMVGFGMKPMLDVQAVFFEVENELINQEHNDYKLREDFADRWNSFVQLNNLLDFDQKIQAFYISDEPTLNMITFDELSKAVNLVKETFPNVPIAVIEAYISLNELRVPENIDWVGFDQYDTIDPNTSEEYQKNYALLKSKLSHPDQKIIIVMDTQWRGYYKTYAGINEEDMADIALNYYEFAQKDEKVIAILGYLWPSGLDLPDQKGARELPKNVQDVYRQIGKEITGK